MDAKLITSTVRDLSPSRKEVSVEIAAEETARKHGLALERLASRVNMPGFRQGKVPLDIVRRKFAEEIERALVDDLAPEALQASFREHSLEAVGLPVIRDVDFEEGRPFRFKAEVDVWPDCDLREYKNIKIPKKELKVEEAEVDAALEQLRLRSAEYLPVQGRGASEGDYVAVEMQGQDVKSKKKFPLEKAVLLAGASPDNPLSEKIVGLSEGQEGQFEIAYPADHHDRRLAGKTVSLRVKVLAVKEKKVPSLDDDLAKTLGDFEDLASLRKRVGDDLLRSKEKAFRGEAAREILDKLAERVPDDLPRTLLERETQDLLRKFLQSPESQGLAAGGKEDVEGIKSRLRKQAERNLKNHLILKNVAAREGLSVGEAEVEDEIRILARANRLPEAGLRSRLEDEDRLEGLKESLLFRKAVDFLVDRAIM